MATKKRRSGPVSSKGAGARPQHVRALPQPKASGQPDVMARMEGVNFGPAGGFEAPMCRMLPWLIETRAEDAGMSWRRGERLEALSLLAGIPVLVQQAQQVLVLELRDAGATWSDVGEALGITKQSAQGRFGPALLGFEVLEGGQVDEN